MLYEPPSSFLRTLIDDLGESNLPIADSSATAANQFALQQNIDKKNKDTVNIGAGQN